MFTNWMFRKISKSAGIIAATALLIFSTPGISQGEAWGKILSDAELGHIYAQGLLVRWKVGVTASSVGAFNLNFNAQGTIEQKSSDKGFLANLGLLGGIFGVNANSQSGNTPKQEETVPIEIRGVKVGEIKTSIEAEGGSATGEPVEIEHGAGGANLSLFSLNGDGIASQAKIDVMFSKVGGLGGTGASLTRSIRNAVCSGCL